MNKTVGEAVAKIPGISRLQIDETLIETSEKLSTYREKYATIIMNRLIERKSSCTRPFIENIDMLNRLYNHPMLFIFNGENMYFAVEDATKNGEKSEKDFLSEGITGKCFEC